MKKLISISLALVLLLACIPMQTSAESAPAFAVGTVEAYPGETVEVPVSIQNNPGIVALKLNISYDSNLLTLQDAVWESLFIDGEGDPAGNWTPSGTLDTIPFCILWENGLSHSNSTENGTIATLTFLVSEDAPAGDVSIALSCSSTFDVDQTDVAFEVVNGAVTVLDAEEGGWSFSEDCTLKTVEGESGLNFVIGLDPIYPVISEYVITTGGWTFDVELNDAEAESTGAKLVIYDANGDVAEEYYSVLFGDITGEGVIDGNDLSDVLYYTNNMLKAPWSDAIFTDEYPQSFAADADHNGVLDGMDLSAIAYHMDDRQYLDQVF